LFTENINLFLERRKDTKTIGEKWEKPKKKKGEKKGLREEGRRKLHPSSLKKLQEAVESLTKEVEISLLESSFCPKKERSKVIVLGPHRTCLIT
jgi:hypothetical protein